jgi:hypothetical protein
VWASMGPLAPPRGRPTRFGTFVDLCVQDCFGVSRELTLAEFDRLVAGDSEPHRRAVAAVTLGPLPDRSLRLREHGNPGPMLQSPTPTATTTSVRRSNWQRPIWRRWSRSSPEPGASSAIARAPQQLAGTLAPTRRASQDVATQFEISIPDEEQVLRSRPAKAYFRYAHPGQGL